MNLPNKLTILRMFLAIVIIFLLLFPFYTINVYFPTYLIDDTLIVDSKYIIAGILFVIASLTDFLDGYLARKYNLITDFGKLVDAIVDKVLVNSALIILATNNFISPVIAVIVILRDNLVNSIKMVAASKGKVVAAINSGKMKTTCLMVGITLTFFYNLPFELWNIKVADFLLISAAVLAIISGMQYYVINRKIVAKKD